MSSPDLTMTELGDNGQQSTAMH